MSLDLDSVGGGGGEGGLGLSHGRHGPPADGIERGEAARRHLAGGDHGDGEEEVSFGSKVYSLLVPLPLNMDEQLK